MRSEKLEIRIPALRLLIAALVLITPICLVGLISISRADRAVATTVGTHFKVFAEISASEVSGFIHDSVMDVGVMAMQSDIVAAVVAANKAYEGKTESASSVRFRIRRTFGQLRRSATGKQDSGISRIPVASQTQGNR